MPQWELREMRLDELRPADYNPRVALRPGDAEYEKLKRSVHELGIVDPLVWNKQTGTLVGGHQQLTVLRDLGYEVVPCWVVNLSPEKERQANLALNKISGRWDEDKLRAVLDGLSPDEVAVAGFDARDLRALYDDGAADVREDEFDVNASLASREEPRTKRGDVVADPFGGSGSTLIASEQLGRTCYTMELDPRYCDVICDRWEKLTGGCTLG